MCLNVELGFCTHIYLSLIFTSMIPVHLPMLDAFTITGLFLFVSFNIIIYAVCLNFGFSLVRIQMHTDIESENPIFSSFMPLYVH